MVGRLLPLAVLAVGLAVVPVQPGLAHHNPIGMPDALGDSSGAPDIVRVTVANDTLDRILFVVQAPNREGVVAGDVVLIRIDSDRSAATGQPDRGAGIDFMLEINGTAGSAALQRWNGAAFEQVQASTLSARFDGGYVMLLHRSEIGNTSSFRFYVLTALAGANPRADVAPDSGTYDYGLSVSHVEGMTPRWTPAAPRAGRTFRLSALRLTLQTGDSVPAARIRCQARLVRTWIRGSGRGACTFRLPRNAKGKRLVLFVTAAPAGGEAEVGQQTFRVR